MNNFEVEKEELALIYQDGFRLIEKNKFLIQIEQGLKRATLNFSIPDNYPKELPVITAEMEGISPAPLEEFLKKAAVSMKGLPMIAFLVGEAIDFISGISDKEIVVQQEQITQTPFTRENFLLWLKKFDAEQAALDSAIQKPITGREMFEKGLINN